MKTAIATDTNSGLTVPQPGLYLLPMPVIVDGKIYAEGVDIHNEQLYEAMKQNLDVSTS